MQRKSSIKIKNNNVERPAVNVTGRAAQLIYLQEKNRLKYVSIISPGQSKLVGNLGKHPDLV